MITATAVIRYNHVKRKVRGVKSATDGATDRTSNAILAEAQRRAPVGKTRAIVSGLRVRVLEVGDEGKGKTVGVGVWGVKEASFQENGTVHNPAHPYLRPAAMVGRRVMKAEAEAAVRRAAEAG